MYVKNKEKSFCCNNYKKNFNQEIFFVSKHSTIPNKLKVNILLETKKNKSFKHISIESNVNDATVITNFKKVYLKYLIMLIKC